MMTWLGGRIWNKWANLSLVANSQKTKESNEGKKATRRKWKLSKASKKMAKAEKEESKKRKAQEKQSEEKWQHPE